MIPVVITLGPIAAANAALLAASQTPVSGTALTLTASQPDVARRILLTYGNEATPRTLRITGTNADGNPIRETLAVPSGASGTIATVQDFLTVSEALPAGGGWTAAVTLGTNTVASSPWKLTNSQHQAVTEVAFGGIVTGTVTWGVEYTYDNPNNNMNQIGGALGNYPTPPTPWTMTGLTGKTGNADGAIDNPIAAWRVVLLSGTGSVEVTAIEGGITESR